MDALILGSGPIAHLQGLKKNVLHAGPSSHSENILSEGGAIAVKNGTVAAIGPEDEAASSLFGDDDRWMRPDVTSVDGIRIHRLKGQAITPSFVDSHTHLVWGGDRSGEHDQRCAGMSYREIAEAGGGIASTVQATRKSHRAHLIDSAERRLWTMLEHGTTIVEAKSGYGLSTKEELRILEIAEDAARSVPVDVHHTWLGAHALPPEMESNKDAFDEYTEELINNQLPEVVKQGIATFADVFCEPGWFSLEQTTRIAEAAASHGLSMRIHADEFTDGGAAGLAARIGAASADHVHHTSDVDRAACAENDVLQTFLPGTPFSMGTEQPDVTQCLSEEWPFGLATDFNPNCQILSMPMVASLAMQQIGLSSLDTIIAMTHNPAISLGLPGRSIAPGEPADLVVLSGPTISSVGLSPGTNPVESVMVDGSFLKLNG